MRDTKRKDHLILLGTLCLGLVLWQGAVANNGPRLFLFASPELVAQAAIQDFATASFWNDIGLTLAEILGGLLIGTITGAALGFLFGLIPSLRRCFAPLIAFLGSIQIFTIAPMTIIWFGIGFGSKIAMAALATLFVTLQQTTDGLVASDSERTAYAQSLGASQLKIARYILLPSVFFWIASGLRLTIGFATLGALVGEFISAEAGLGHYIFSASGIYDVPRVLLGVGILSLINLAFQKLAGLLVPPPERV